ncbi:MAG: ornithine carbamoyltransferase [Pseudomonadota bacterium]
MSRHFLRLQDLSNQELSQVIDDAIDMKKRFRDVQQSAPAKGLILGMIFEKASTRTRVSFEAGMAQLGGSAIFLDSSSTQMSRGEPIEDTARVLSSMLDIIMIRTFEHSNIERFAEYANVPVINALTNDTHPCQLLADMQTFKECRGDIRGKTVTWVGDGNNMCQSYINAADCFDFKLRIACPKGYEPDPAIYEPFKHRIYITDDPRDACQSAHLVSTDVWASMGQEENSQKRIRDFDGFKVDHDLMALASDDAIFMHCLPAHREEEVSAALLEDPKYSVVWQQAENRLHAQKALMVFLLNAEA